MNPDTTINTVLTRVRYCALAVGLTAVLPTAVGAFLQPAKFYPAYLIAILFWWSISAGCLALSMLHHLTGGGWGAAIRRTLEAGCGTLPVIAVLFIPILLGLPYLYPWARPDAVSQDPVLQHKAPYLNAGFFQTRAAIYFVIWVSLAWLTNRLSAGTDPRYAARQHDRLAAVSGPGMILWSLTVTFAAIDWTMSLEPHWLSSIHGLIFMAGQAVAALAFALIVIIPLRGFPPIVRVLNESRLHDLGNLLLAFTLFWSYVSLVQYLVIWSGNLPEESHWYIRRQHGGWHYVALLLIVFHFAIPFLLLLNRRVKRHGARLLPIAILLLGMRLVEFYWQVMPTFAADMTAINWLTVVATIAIGGLWFSAFAWLLSQRLSVPVVETHPLEEARDEYADGAVH